MCVAMHPLCGCPRALVWIPVGCYTCASSLVQSHDMSCLGIVIHPGWSSPDHGSEVWHLDTSCTSVSRIPHHASSITPQCVYWCCGGLWVLVLGNALHGPWPMTCCGSHDTGEDIPGSWILGITIPESVSHDLGWIHGSHPYGLLYHPLRIMCYAMLWWIGYCGILTRCVHTHEQSTYTSHTPHAEDGC